MENSEELDKAFLNYADALNVHKNAVQQKEDNVTKFLQDFENIAETVIELAFNEVLEKAKLQGHSGNVRISKSSSSDRKENRIQASAITLEIFVKDIKKTHNGKEPHIFFNARSDNADSRKVQVIHNFFTSGELKSGGRITFSHTSQVAANEYTVENITYGIAKEEAIKFLTELFNSIKIIG